MTDLRIPSGDEAVSRLIALALAEDIGAGDITCELLIDADQQAQMALVARGPIVACGMFAAAEVYRQLDASVTVEVVVEEGQVVEAGVTLAVVRGCARSVLTGERTALNLMQRLSGVAGLTRQFVAAVEGTGAVILDTRKTMPGMRVLDKFAVRAGGGQNHRMRLDDMVLVKDNHIALAGGIEAAVARVRGHSRLPVVIECDTLEQVERAVQVLPERILLDNMSVAQIKEALALVAGRVKLEASGNVSLETVREIAGTGVGYISVGKLTHSVQAADIGADISFT